MTATHRRAPDATTAMGDLMLPSGAIAWSEYATADVDRTREFFCALFGWGWRSKQFAHVGSYVTWTLDGRDVAGMLRLEDLTSGCERAGWFSVLRVDNVDALSARCCELGARLLIEPTGLAGLGRHAMLAGPSGVRFALLDGLDGRSPRGVGCVGWNEFRAGNPAKSALFCWQGFGWQAEGARDPAGGLVTVFLQGGHRVASMRKADDEEENRTLPCIEVDDPDATARRACDLGGRMTERRDDDPILGRVARLVDPLGVDFIVYRR